MSSSSPSLLVPGAALCLLGACTAAQAPPPPEPSPPLVVEALSPPVAWLVREIGGERVEVREITPPGVDPTTFRPDPARIAALAEADLIVASGAGFEAWLALASVPPSRLLDTSRGLALLQGDGPVHRHGEGPEHSHTGPLPHVWLDPALYAAQADRIAQALAARDPEHAQDYAARGEAARTRLAPLSTELSAIGARLAGRPVLANHPTFAYLGRAAGLQVTAGAIDAKSEDPAPLLALIGDRTGALVLWDDGPKVDLLDPLPSTVDHRVLDPVATAGSPGGDDPIARMQANLDRLADAAPAATTDTPTAGAPP